MKKLKLAVFAYHHSESTLPLVKHLANAGHFVDYYFVTTCRQESAPAFSFGRKVWLPGIRRGNKKYMKPYYDYMASDRVRIFLVVLPPYAHRYFHFLSRLLFSFMGLFLKLLRYDYLNVVGQNPLLLDLFRTLGPGNNIYTSLHEVTPHYASQHVSYKLIDHLLSANMNIVTHSNASRDKLLQYGNAVDERIHVIPFGVFETYALFDGSDCGMPFDKPYILYYGTLLPYKGLDVLHEAVKLLGHRLDGMKVVVAGRGTDECLPMMINDSRFFVINRYVSNEEIVALNNGAYCVVCPYKSASQSGIVCTTFLFGKPIIASDVGAFREYIVDGRNGLLVSPGDPVALAGSLLRLMADAGFYEMLRKSASTFSSSPTYAWDGIADKYIKMFTGQAHEIEELVHEVNG